ncbi:MAG: 3-hydroxyacyl-CoA dehydrogenase family protein [Ginsengibacter sp.]
MRIFINASSEQETEIRSKNVEKNIEISYSKHLPLLNEYTDFDIFFILDERIENVDFEKFEKKPVFVNLVSNTLSKLKLPGNVSRINAWNGFLQREIWEIVPPDNIDAKKIFSEIGWQIIIVKDEPGMVAARVISMIINEAFYAFSEKVSTKAEIDMAMKLGTNYPFGPFEWAEKIGIKKVFDLLKILSEKEKRYIPSFNVD